MIILPGVLGWGISLFDGTESVETTATIQPQPPRLGAQLRRCLWGVGRGFLRGVGRNRARVKVLFVHYKKCPLRVAQDSRGFDWQATSPFDLIFPLVDPFSQLPVVTVSLASTLPHWTLFGKAPGRQGSCNDSRRVDVRPPRT